ncbi:unnamed protein product [Didymodactylos carnosus]|uniref:OTU domain-containing protein n=1 Tax=Didymodactylos carnosus TaxID=1234261 RepID=A0A8S2DRS3_9BILA|nr:unnamed protein product [Didymodactylos carnosus]CAF3763638.1 unnamed protein product [Didymodactylos carnosus]
MVPLTTNPDGNCLYNAVKVLMPNFEASPVELRVRANVELAVKLKDYQQTYPHCTDFIDPFRQYQRTEIIYDKNYSTLWEILALCNILQCSIRSVYPKIREDADDAGMSDLLNKTFHPFSTTNSTKSTSTITVMWTHTAEEDTVRAVNYGMWVPNHFVPLVYHYDTKSSFTIERHPPPIPAKRTRFQSDIFSGVVKEDTHERTLRINIEDFIKKDETLKDNTMIEDLVRKSLDSLKKASQVCDKEILQNEVKKKLHNLISHKIAYARKHHQTKSTSWPQYYIEVKIPVEPFGHSVMVNEDEADTLNFTPHATSSSTITKKVSPPIQFSGVQFHGRHDKKYIEVNFCDLNLLSQSQQQKQQSNFYDDNPNYEDKNIEIIGINDDGFRVQIPTSVIADCVTNFSEFSSEKLDILSDHIKNLLKSNSIDPIPSAFAPNFSRSVKKWLQVDINRITQKAQFITFYVPLVRTQTLIPSFNTNLRPRIPTVHFNAASSPSPLSPRVSSSDDNLKIIYNPATTLIAYQSNFDPLDHDDAQQKSTANVNVSNKQKTATKTAGASTSTLRKYVSDSTDFSDSENESKYDEDYLSNKESLMKQLSNTFAKMTLSWKMQFSITNRAYVSLIELARKLDRSLPQFKVVNKLKQTIQAQIPLQECKYGWYLHVFHAMRG